MSNSKILFLLSGSIAAVKASLVISKLVQQGHEVQAVATPSALKFVGEATLEGFTGRRVLTDLWQSGRAMDHIHLTRWADLAVLCPASANTLAKLRMGQADDLLSALALAWPQQKPFHVFPAMNAHMLAAEATQENLKILSARHFMIHSTSAGNLACGETGDGRMLEPDEILARLFYQRKGRALITAGATRESIDGIRFLSNVSTGQTAAKLSDYLRALGWQVTYLHGQGSMRPLQCAEIDSFTDFASLENKLRAHLGQKDFQLVIQCAAVSDYSVSEVNGQTPQIGAKLVSDHALTLNLKRNPKLLPLLKEFSRNKNVFVVGFKLTLNASDDDQIAKARTLLDGAVDAVVANDWSTVQANRQTHPGHWVQSESTSNFSDLKQLAELIHQGVTHDFMP